MAEPKNPSRQLDLFDKPSRQAPKKAVLYADGASFGNPGPSGIGAYIEVEGKSYEFSEPIGHATNNIAEYTAFIRGLEEAVKLRIDELDVRLDSELLVRQINGVYKVKNEKLKPLHEKAKALLGFFSKVTVSHIPRELNTKADALSKKAAEASQKRIGKADK